VLSIRELRYLSKGGLSIMYEAEATLVGLGNTVYCKQGSMAEITMWLHGFITREVATCNIQKKEG
jgi:hypothetical protein